MAGFQPGLAAIVVSPWGRLGVYVRDSQVCGITLLGGEVAERAPNSRLAETAIRQLQCYFADPAFPFSLPLASPATGFQQRIRDALLEIPPGASMTYGQVARRLETAPRAVGAACRANPLPVIVPCHRVTAATGQGGYAGATSGYMVAIKGWLLSHESVVHV